MSRRALAIVALAVAFGATAAVAVALWPDRGSDGGATAAAAGPNGSTTEDTAEDGPATGEREPDGLIPSDSLGDPSALGQGGSSASGDVDPAADSRFALETVPLDPPVQVHLKRPPAGGVLFDLDSGEVLWERRSTAPLPIASLTKLMTALMVVEEDDPGERVLISPKAANTPGSATGILPQGKEVPLEALLQALIMISANDAAVALAEHHSGSLERFIKEMNRRAAPMGLDCTHFNTPNGLKDLDNYSCPLDVAALARAGMADERIARIARTRSARPAFPIKGGLLHLANNHYFLSRGVSGVPGARVTGLKTGLTDAAGRCYVTTARLGSRHLGVVLLGSPDPLRQVPVLLRAGFEATGDLPVAPTHARRKPAR